MHDLAGAAPNGMEAASGKTHVEAASRKRGAEVVGADRCGELARGQRNQASAGAVCIDSEVQKSVWNRSRRLRHTRVTRCRPGRQSGPPPALTVSRGDGLTGLTPSLSECRRAPGRHRRRGHHRRWPLQ
jgi:hypothetical protein